MHQDPRLPSFLRLDDGRVAERERPAGSTLSESARACPPTGDPLLLALARQALDGPPGNTVMIGTGGAAATIAAPPGGGLGLIGLRCPPATTALASSAGCQTVEPDGRRRRGVIAWSVDRHGGSLALFREEAVGGSESLSAVAGTLLDASRRALGLPTPPCCSPAVWFPDGVFLHRVAGSLARRGRLCTRRPLSWANLSVLYPLNDTGDPLPSWLTMRRRQRFEAANTWGSLRLAAAGLSPESPAILPGLTPDVAGWLDDGAFARWVLSRLPDVPSTLEWLRGRVAAPLQDHLSIALGDVHGPSTTAP